MAGNESGGNMIRSKLIEGVRQISLESLDIPSNENFMSLSAISDFSNQNSTNSAFTRKWGEYNESEEKEKCFQMQKEWYLKLYGFSSEQELADFLKGKKYIYDAGCGIGYKTAWFATLAPESIVIGMDFSEAALQAAHNYKDIPNLFFMQGDIGAKVFKDNSIDYVNCDQVIMHTENPAKTFSVLASITKDDGQFACYFYAKKALPRELLDEHFRKKCGTMSHDEIMAMSEQLTELGKRLSEINVTFDAPDIPAMGIKGGKIDIQRFIYWNFLKCFWNENLGRHTSIMTNFDWYSPSNAQRFSKSEVEELLEKNNMDAVTFHSEEACYSGRFKKRII
jgi:SAM-dependent methyltransferase